MAYYDVPSIFFCCLRHHPTLLKVRRYRLFQKDVISFAAGIASVDTIPAQAFEGIEDQLITGRERLLVSPVTGFYSLRKVNMFLYAEALLFCQPIGNHVLSGSQQGIDLITRAFINPGDVVIIEEPPSFLPYRLSVWPGRKSWPYPWTGTG